MTAVVRTTSLRGPWRLTHRAVSPERPQGHFVPLGHILPYDTDAAHSPWGGGGDCVKDHENRRRLWPKLLLLP